MAQPTLLTLPLHLRLTLSSLLSPPSPSPSTHRLLPPNLHERIASTLAQPSVPFVTLTSPDEDVTGDEYWKIDEEGDEGKEGAEGKTGKGRDEVETVVVPTPPTIDAEVIDELARWAATEQGRAALVAAGLEPGEYQVVSLLAGTEVYLPPKQRDLFLSSSPVVSPYLPSYLSPAPPSMGQEYRTLARQLSTLLNIAFSIVGSGFAVYVAATTGAGYTRETGVLLGVLAGVVVGVADGVLVWIFQDRLDKDRRAAAEMARKVMTGSGSEGVRQDEDGEGEEEEEMGGEAEWKEKEGKTQEGPVEATAVARRSIRIRRRAVGEVDTSR